MNDPIKSSQQRTQRYWYIDGLNELGFGLVCLLLAVYFFVQEGIQDALPAGQLLNLGLMLFIIGGSFAFRTLVRKVKERITYPRTGYVAYRRTRRSRLLGLIAAAIFSGAVFAAVFSFFVVKNMDQWMGAVSGLIIAAVWGLLGFRLNILRFYALAAYSLAAGYLVSWLDLNQELSLVGFYALLSVAMFVSGGLTLRNYLRTAPPPEEAQV